MPARIDPEQRSRQIVGAAFSLVVAEGIESMSLRKVAEESGLNIGSLDVPETELAVGQIEAMIGGLTLDSLTPHGGLGIDRVRVILRAHLRLLLAGQG